MKTDSAPLRGLRERRGSPWLREADARPVHTATPSPGLDAAWSAPGAFPTTVAPTTALGAYLDWWMNLAASPAKQLELATESGRLAADTWRVCSGQSVVEPLPQDKRFADPAWQAPPYHAMAQVFQLWQRWWHRATTGVPGISRHHEDMVSFAARQWLDMVAPSNFISTNPVVRQRTVEQGGHNLWRGALHALDDLQRDIADLPPLGAENFTPGVHVAVTPGRVVHRNRLMELIQYEPSTPSVHPEPVLLVPAWIMKYYVLDLSPSNSLVRYLVSKGFTVFAISWKNPDSGDRELGMDDYAHLGVLEALDTIARIVPGKPVHAAGYCLGGTLLSTVAAWLGRQRRASLKTLTLLAAQTDFTEPGELALFVDEAQVAYLERLMSRHGYLDKRQMRATFQLLRSNDLVWSHRLRSHLLGERETLTDLMAWNADGTRLPYRMHMEYLQSFFLRNALARGEWRVQGSPVHLSDIRVPVFNVGTVQDHVAPWRSVYKLHALCDAEQTFVLTAGGHNVGIVNPPGNPVPSSYRVHTRHADDPLLTPDEWLQATPLTAGSWWEAWSSWLAKHSGRRGAAPRMGLPGLPADDRGPGHYVHQR
ncbi:alpha/beta hydrolase [Piscinibacter sp. HJYY11]|uniref:PHA/PHB synthase family protein n=1 Tax=Piscinibacter sp. HJYY11 TaxID=2801333 RepID=UPI00191D2702|nr:alpha/beta fold hydrolase [Piscinibacter sp. HJYY11]MBL0726584.1 alpha/beta fold hydrolase [Piscinibacter sp. HJYY11]